MFILYAIPLGILAGYLLGGRISRLADLRLRWIPLALIGLFIQVSLFSDWLPADLGDAAPASRPTLGRPRPPAAGRADGPALSRRG